MSPHVVHGRRQPPSRRRRIPALWIAALMIIVPVFVTYYAFHKRLPFTSQYTDYVVVPNSLNVRGGDPVRIAGIDVGSVEGTSPDGRATRIAFSLGSNGLPIHRDATITVRPRLFLEGSYYLDLFPGSPSAPTAPQGFTISQRNAATPVQAFQVLSTLDVAARANLESLLNTANTAFSPAPGAHEPDSGAGGFKQAIPQLAPLLKDVAWVSRALRGTQPGDVEKLLASSAEVTTALDVGSGTRLAGLVSGLDRASAGLAAGDDDLGRSLVALDATLQVAPSALTALDRSLPSLRELSTALTPTLRAAPPLVSQLTSAVNQVNAVVTPARRGDLISSLRTTLATFPTVLTKIGRLFAVSGPVTDCLRTHLLPILTEEVPDGALSTGEPVWKDFVHFLPSLASASGDFDGNGPFIRNILGAGDNSVQGGVTSLPGIGQLVGTSPGGEKIEGETPQWVGTLSAKDFRPDAPCATQPVPSLAATPAAPDLHRVSDAAPLVPTVPQLERALSQATGHTVRRLP